MQLLSLGSLNLDEIYRLPHIVTPGETITSISHTTAPGGKGANQAVALARARTDKQLKVFHAGMTGPEQQAQIILKPMEEAGINVSFIKHMENGDTGTAIIQVQQDNAENAIILHPGANHKIDKGYIDHVLEHFNKGDVILLQNEISEGKYAIEAAEKKGK
jgi:ribokinase